MICELEQDVRDQVEEALKDVIDPEIGINVVDLGLIYGLGWDDTADKLMIYMTLTTAECPLQDDLASQTQAALTGVVEEHEISWVWMPAWSTARITDDGRDMMRALGFNV